MIRYFDRRGEPMSQGEWVQAMAVQSNKLVAMTEMPGGTRIATTWQGLDMSQGKGPPLIFQTLAYRGSKEESDLELYATEDEAVAGHAAMVQKWSVRR